MARFGLTSWVGQGTEANPFVPRGIDGNRAVIDLRPDPTVSSGVCLYIADAVTTNQVLRDLGEESLDAPLSPQAINWVDNNLGVTLAATTLREAIAELLVLWGEADLPGRTKWKRLLSTSDGRHRIVMRDRVIYDALAPVNATVSDDFNRANQALAVSANWNDIAIFGGDSTFSIVSNVALAQGTSTAFGEWNANFGINQWAQANASGINNAQAGLILRCSDPSNNMYLGYWRGGNDAWRIGKTVAASFSVLSEDTGGPASISGVSMLFTANGSTLTLWVDGVQKLQTTDTSITDLRIGIMGWRDSSTGSLDNFQGGDITNPTVITQGQNRLIKPGRRRWQIDHDNSLTRGLVAFPDLDALYDPVMREPLEQTAVTGSDVLTRWGLARNNTLSAGAGGILYKTANGQHLGVSGGAARTTMVAFRSTNVDSNTSYFTMGTATGAGLWMMGFHGAGAGRWRFGVNSEEMYWSTNPANGEDYVAIVTYPGGGADLTAVNLYVNGVLQGSKSYSGTGSTVPNTSFTTIRMGFGRPSTSGLYSFPDQSVVAGGVWNRVLTFDEIQRISHDPFALIRPRDTIVIPSAAAGTTYTLYATADGTISSIVNELDTTTNLYQSVDDDPATPTDSDWVNNVGGAAGSVFFDLTNTPTDFSSMLSMTGVFRWRSQSTSNDVTLYAQLFQSDESTSLSDEVQVVVTSTDSSFVNTGSVSFTNVSTTASKAVWDAARIRLRWV